MASQEELDRQLAEKLQSEEKSSGSPVYRAFDLDEDRILAEKLQKEEEAEYAIAYETAETPRDSGKITQYKAVLDQHKKLSLVDPQWETIDPTPDIHALFRIFDDTFFWGRLRSCEVRWSPRMTVCAGICCYQYRSGFCSIRLSKPLLSLRPRADLVETLLHEMIHALLFVTNNNSDRDGHGPEFHKHMYRINKQAGTKISVYHSFHDEVRHYKVHHWRCDGPCKDRHPFYGWVKRSMNRAPSKNDFWWADHQRTCGGTFIKVSEPEKKDKGKQNNKRKSPDSECPSSLKKYFKSDSSQLDETQPGPSGTSNGNSRKVSTKKSDGQSTSNISGFPSRTGVASRSSVITIKGHTESQKSPEKNDRSFVPFQGTGHVLGSVKPKQPNQSNLKKPTQPTVDDFFRRKDQRSSAKQERPQNLMDLFSDDESAEPTEVKSAQSIVIDLTEPNEQVTCPVCSAKVQSSLINSHIDACLS